MNKQEIFETVVRHLHAQGRPAMNGDNCRYRSSDGLSCAVGCLIPDSCYDSNLENQTSSMPNVQKALCKAGILTGGDEDQKINNLLSDLQYAHDHWMLDADGGYRWEDEAAMLAGLDETHDVTWPGDVPCA